MTASPGTSPLCHCLRALTSATRAYATSQTKHLNHLPGLELLVTLQAQNEKWLSLATFSKTRLYGKTVQTCWLPYTWRRLHMCLTWPMASTCLFSNFKASNQDGATWYARPGGFANVFTAPTLPQLTQWNAVTLINCHQQIFDIPHAAILCCVSRSWLILPALTVDTESRPVLQGERESYSSIHFQPPLVIQQYPGSRSRHIYTRSCWAVAQLDTRSCATP